MKTKLAIFASSLLLSASALAISPDKVDFSKIQMNDLHVVDVKTAEDSIGYKFKPLLNPSADLLTTLADASYSEVVSPIYELNQKSAFKNIYLYIGKTAEGAFEFVMAMHNSRGNFFVVDMDITNVEKTHLDAVHGATYEQRQIKIYSGAGDLFQ